MANWFTDMTKNFRPKQQSAGLDVKWLGRRLATGDFKTAANYLGMFSFSDPQMQLTVNQQIKNLNEYGDLMNAVIRKAGPDAREQVAHHFQKYFGTGDTTNKYTKAYLDNINAIGNTSNKQAVYIDYVFDDDTAYGKFVDAFGGELPTMLPNEEKGGTYVENGKKGIRVYKEQLGNNVFFSKLTQALDASVTTAEKRDNSIIPNMYFGRTPSTHTEIVSGYTSSSFDADGNKIAEQRGLFKSQALAENFNKDAEKLVKDITSKLNKIEIPSELMVKGYMCKAERDITNAVLSGQLETSVGNFGLGQVKDYYDRMFNATSLTNFDVYATDANPETQNLKAITRSEDKSELTEYIRAAIGEKRVTFSAASAGGRVGTVITINPKLDKDDNPIGNMKSSRQIFVPGLFEEDAKDVMDEDPEAAVLYKRAQCVALDNGYNLYNGTSLTKFQSDGSATLKRGDVEYKLSSDNVHQMMLENETVRAAVDELTNVKYMKGIDDDIMQDLVEQSAQKIYYYFNPQDLEATNADAKKQIEDRIKVYVDTILKNIM